jgi:hypothetical protein
VKYLHTFVRTSSIGEHVIQAKFASPDVLHRATQSDSRPMRIEIRTLSMSHASDNYHFTLHGVARQKMCAQYKLTIEQ